ncbi:hypothetical protein ACRQ1B_06130 [Rhizobium panacihumi]|uniref:hypothetical protein n=1 Tax=Rhizobium panacihumi TaxID=2008450 RepID=UPI003D7A591C
MSTNDDVGARKVGGLIRSAEQKVKRKIAEKQDPYPDRGGQYDGLKPGEWNKDGAVTDPTGFLPYNTPVRPLGYDGEDYYFVDTMGQVFNTGTASMGVERIQKLFAGHEPWLDWAFPSFDNKGRVTGFKSEMVRRALYAACRERGAWSSADMVRGRGAWRDHEGKLILHCGDHLWINGDISDTGEHGEHLYVRRPRSMSPWPDAVHPDDNPAPGLVKILRTWNMGRGDVDAVILLGAIGVAMLGGALNWRPSVMIVGDAGVGKSELTGPDGVLKTVLGRMMVSTTNATEAGLYQLVGHDSVPIAVDELEGEDGIEQAQKVIKMARDAASGSVRIRGGQNHRGVEFQARSTFFFSGINPPPMPPASLTRLAIIELMPLKAGGKPPVLQAPETVGPRLLRILADRWKDLQYRLDDYANILQEHGHDSRGQKTFGTFLAVAHTMLGDEGLRSLGLPWDDLSKWGEWLSAESVPELEGKAPTWEQALLAVLTSVIENYSGGARRTVAQELERIKDGESIHEVRDRLSLIDLGLVEDPQRRKSYLLAIPHDSRVLAKALNGTPFSNGLQGNWKFAFRRGDPRVVMTKVELTPGKFDNRVSVAGRQARCSFISLHEYTRWLAK